MLPTPFSVILPANQLEEVREATAANVRKTTTVPPNARHTPSAVVTMFSPRVTNGRRSFAAALWNPMSDEERRSFNKRRFLQLVVGIFMAVMVGVQYAFGIVSNRLKHDAGFSQSDMTTITTVGNCLFAFSFPAGVLFDYAGPKPVLICAVIFGCVGFILLALIFGGVIAPTVATVAIANGLPNWQAGFVECAALLSNLFVFPTNKGEVVILQKTFFGLGSTFFSLSFHGFFSESDDYLGYCIYVACLIFFVVTIGAFNTHLPTYKRTTRELHAIAKMSPADAERAKMMEEQSFEMHHNPRLSDRRRLNYGVTMLLITLVFFTSLSCVEAFLVLDSRLVTALTFLAIGCIGSFAVMLLPRNLPSFFDYEFLPDIHPPEALMDKPLSKRKRRQRRNAAATAAAAMNSTSDFAATYMDAEVRQESSEEEEMGGESAVLRGDGEAGDRTERYTGGRGVRIAATADAHREERGEGPNTVGDRRNDRPNSHEESALQHSTSEEEGGHPLSTAVPAVATGGIGGSDFLTPLTSADSLEGPSSIVSPSSASGSVMAGLRPLSLVKQPVPSINTKFLDSLKHPFIWCLWFGTFAIMGTNFVFVNNITQIYVALNNGEFVKSSNSLNVALIGIGSAIGRICTGFGETYLHRINAIHRDRQLEHMVRQELNLLTSDDVAPDMTPVYHRWNASIVMLLPLSPLVVGLMCLATLIVPPAALGVVLIVYSGFVGLYQTLLALSVREIFSVDVAKHLNFIFSSGIIATILLNRVMFGGWYDAEYTAQQQHQPQASSSSSSSSLSRNGGNSFGGGGITRLNDDQRYVPADDANVAIIGSLLNLSAEPTTIIIMANTSTEVPSNTTTPAPSDKVYECVGVSCIRNSFLVLAAVNGVAVGCVSFVAYYWWQVRRKF